jgi:hypothetical protein
MNELGGRLAVAICLTITFDTLINISVDWGCQFQSTVRDADEQLLTGSLDGSIGLQIGSNDKQRWRSNNFENFLKK